MGRKWVSWHLRWFSQGSEGCRRVVMRCRIEENQVQGGREEEWQDENEWKPQRQLWTQLSVNPGRRGGWDKTEEVWTHWIWKVNNSSFVFNKEIKFGSMARNKLILCPVEVEHPGGSKAEKCLSVNLKRLLIPLSSQANENSSNN